MIVRRHKADDSNKDRPKSGSGSRVKPILEHLYHENPKNLNAEKCAFGDGVTAIMQGGGVIAKENHTLMSKISGPRKCWWWTTIDIVKYKGIVLLFYV